MQNYTHTHTHTHTHYTNLILSSLSLLVLSDLLQLLRGHAFPAVSDHAVRAKGTLCDGGVLRQDVTIDVVGNLCQVVIKILLFL